MNKEHLKWAFRQGWYMCARWAGRDDLDFDVDSPAFISQRDEILDRAPTEDEVCLCIDCFGTEHRHHESCAAMIDMHGSFYDKVMQQAKKHNAAADTEYSCRESLVELLRPLMAVYLGVHYYWSTPRGITVDTEYGDLVIDTEEFRNGEVIYNSYRIPLSIIKSDDPVAALRAHKQEEAERNEALSTEEKIERAKKELRLAQEKLDRLTNKSGD